MKKIIVSLFFILISLVFPITFAEDNWHIVPEGGIGPRPKYEPTKVWDTYNGEAKGNENLPGYAFASGTFTWTTIMSFIAHLVKFISGVGLVIGACMIIFGGYKYATGVFTGKSTTGNEPIKLAIIGVLIIIFSYAIMKIMILAFLGG